MSTSQRFVVSCLWSSVAPRPVLPVSRLAPWLALLVVFVLAACTGAWAAPVPWAGNGHWYEPVYVGPGGITRTNAQNAASASGGYLATCTSAAENDFVYSLVSGNNDFWFLDHYGNGIGPWLGGYNQGGWKWGTGEPWSYANWTPQHPAGSENFMGFLGLGTLKAKTWANFFDNQPCRGYIVERESLAYFSVYGRFADGPDGGDDEHNFSFTLADDVPSGHPFGLRTWHHGGSVDNPPGTATNAAGASIPGGGFDPVLTLFDSGGRIAENDNGQGLPSNDSVIDHNTPGVDPLQAGGYRLRLGAANQNLGGRDPNWAVDLIAPTGEMTLTAIAGDGALTSLVIGPGATMEISGGNAIEWVGPGNEDGWLGVADGGAFNVVGPGSSLRYSNPSSSLRLGLDNRSLPESPAMSITQGASVQFDDYTSVTLCGEAALVVDGMGTTLDFSGDMVDLIGGGGVAVTNGGHVTASHVGVGDLPNNIVSLRVEGNGSRWTSTGTMSLGCHDDDPWSDDAGYGQLLVHNGATLDVGQQLDVEVGEVELDDATVIFHRPDALQGGFTYVSGTIQFDTDLTIADSGETVNILFGASPLIPADKQLAVTGTATLQTTTTIDGGTLSVGSLAGPEYLQFNTGTFNLTGDNLTVAPDGLFGTQLTVEAQQTINVANTASVNPGGSLTVETGGSFSSGQLANFGTVEFDSLHVGGDDSAAGRTGTLTVGLGGTVNVANTLKIWDDGTVNLNGGTINTGDLVFSGSTLNFNAGKLHFTSDPGLDAALLAKIFGPAPTVSGDQHLSVAGLTVLLEPLILDGGTFSVGTLVNPASLQFNTGTLNLTEDDLKIGLGGLFGHTLEVTDDQTIQVTNGAHVDLTGLLLISGGAFVPDSTSNFGEIRLGGGNSLLAGHGLGNNGVISGDGRISSPLSNFQGGLIGVGPGQRLLLTGGAGGNNTNEGTMTTTGGEMEVLNPLNNSGQINVVDGTFSVGGTLMNVGPTSYISGQGNVTLRFGEVLSNNGTVGLSAAEASLYGEIYNGPGGLIAVAGQSTATFVGGLENNGDVYVGEGSSAVFLSRVSGSGDFPGGGDVEFVDGFDPGNIPASVDFGGNVVFASTASLEIELAGTSAQDPVEFDQLVIAEDLTLSGVLDVLLIDGFMPELGDEFLIVTFGSVAGDFDTYSGLDLGGGLWLEPSFTSHGLVLTTVPEPSTLLMLTALGAGLLAIAARRRWRRRVA